MNADSPAPDSVVLISRGWRDGRSQDKPLLLRSLKLDREYKEALIRNFTLALRLQQNRTPNLEREITFVVRKAGKKCTLSALQACGKQENQLAFRYIHLLL
jgi:hypothetical protein